MKRFIDYHVAFGYFKEDNLYSNNYSIEITDFCFSALTLDKNSYVLLSGSDFSIQKLNDIKISLLEYKGVIWIQ